MNAALRIAVVLTCAAFAAGTGAAAPLSAPQDTGAPAPVPAASTRPPGPIIDTALTGTVTRYAVDRLARAIRAAEDRGAAAVLVRLDTPGGLLDATRDAVQRIIDAPVPIIVYVSPGGARAGSAGLFFALAAHVAAMAPATNIGAAHPVSATGESIEGDMGKKVTNDTAAWARTLARLRGRDERFAEDAVRDSRSITETEALAAGAVDIVAPTVDALLEKVNGRTVRVRDADRVLVTAGARLETIESTPADAVYNALADPNLTYVLLLAGLAGLFIEYNAPGLILPGLLGGLCLAVVFGTSVLPLNGLGVLLIVGGVVLLVVELYVVSLGLLAVAALVCIGMGSLLLFDVPGADVHVDRAVIAGALGGIGIVVLGFGWALVRSLRRRLPSGVFALAHETGEVTVPVSPDAPGRVLMHGTEWKAVADAPIAAGTPVRLVSRRGLTLRVTPTTPEPESPP